MEYDIELVERLCDLLTRAAEVIKKQHELIKLHCNNSIESDQSLLEEIQTLV